MVWPLALRALRRSWPGRLLTAAILGLAVAAYLLYATFLTGAVREAGMLLRASELPCDLVFLGTEPLSAAEIARIARGGGVESCEPARATWYRTAAGYLRVVALPPDSAIWSQLAPPESSGSAPPVPGPGEVVLPSQVAELCGLEPAGEMLLSPARAASAGIACRISGVHQAADDLLGPCAFALLPESGPAPNSLFVWTDSARAASSLAWTLEAEQMGPTRPVMRTITDAAILTRDRPEQIVRGILSQAYLPAAGVMAMVFVFCGIGLFTAVTLEFLGRKRDIAILKTVGLDSSGLVAMLAAEQGLIALAGVTLGVVVAAVLIPELSPHFPGSPSLAAVSVIKGGVAGALVLAAAIYVPAASAKVATVNQLLHNLPVPLRTQRVGGQTGA